jgi:hypothetical protein
MRVQCRIEAQPRCLIVGRSQERTRLFPVRDGSTPAARLAHRERKQQKTLIPEYSCIKYCSRAALLKKFKKEGCVVITQAVMESRTFKDFESSTQAVMESRTLKDEGNKLPYIKTEVLHTAFQI